MPNFKKTGEQQKPGRSTKPGRLVRGSSQERVSASMGHVGALGTALALSVFCWCSCVGVIHLGEKHQTAVHLKHAFLCVYSSKPVFK